MTKTTRSIIHWPIKLLAAFWHKHKVDLPQWAIWANSFTKAEQKNIKNPPHWRGILFLTNVSRQTSDRTNKPLVFSWENLTGCSCQASTSNEPGWTKPFYFRYKHLSALTTASSFMGKREEGASQQHMVTVACNGMHAWGWNSHDLFKELMVHTTKIFTRLFQYDSWQALYI